MEIAILGPCKACLYEDELYANGLCASCQPANPAFASALLDLLNNPDTARVEVLPPLPEGLVKEQAT